MIQFSQLEAITGGHILTLAQDNPIGVLLTDSRKVIVSPGSLFFAIRGIHHDGHRYISSLYAQGIRQFVVEYPIDATKFAGSNFIVVSSSVDALQALASHHRASLEIQVIGVTGSNGKTIIKEWLYQLLSADYHIAKNPGSYNSQIGVPLSVWQLQPHHQLGIFEAGISKPHEMEKLEKVIKPTIGIFTNIGSAHDEGFSNTEEKIAEKLKLFRNSNITIYCKDHTLIDQSIRVAGIRTLSWGFAKDADIVIEGQDGHHTITHGSNSFTLTLPFSDHASVENCLHCVVTMLHLGFSSQHMQEKINLLKAIPMRLELREGINQCVVIDDTYNNDLAGLQISLEFLSNQQQKNKKTLILSDILESGLTDEALTTKISALTTTYNIQRFIGIGRVLSSHRNKFSGSSIFYSSTEDFLAHFNVEELQQEVILVKGARIFQFEKIVNKLQRKVHGTVMEIDLGAIVHNLNYFKGRLKPSTKIMVMVKAFAYGSGSVEIANILQYHKVDYLGVAYADEGVDLRKNNITLPVMVMNPSEESFDALISYNLEPEIYNFKIFLSYLNFLQGRKSVIHVKIDTGMHRLGFEEKDLQELIHLLQNNKNVSIASIFSHLAGADEAVHDQFSKSQAERFISLADKISSAIGYRPLYHLINSPGILRLPHLQFDMVRLGIGLYGVDPTEDNLTDLRPVATLKTIISQIRFVKSGETIGYGRKGKAERDMKLATIAIGYADGFSRAFSQGKGELMVKGKLAKVIGNVCMDMTMIDITNIDAREGDEVIIFGNELPIQRVANSINTIAYEILTNTSERVKRVFVAESI